MRRVNRETPGNLTNQIAVQSLIYKAARAYSGLSSQLTILAIRRVCGNRKTAKQKNKPVRKFAATSANYDSRTFTLNESQWQVSLTMMKGREKFPLAIGNYQRHLLTSQKPKSATLVKKRSGDYCLQIQIHSEPPKTKETDKCLGVDLGRRDIAVTSAGHSFSGEQTTKVRAHFSRVRQSVQQKASKGASEFAAKMPSISSTVKWTRTEVSSLAKSYNQLSFGSVRQSQQSVHFFGRFNWNSRTHQQETALKN